MSDRTLALPGRAMEEMLSSLLDRSRRGANYQQWPGAARLTTLDVGNGTAVPLPNGVITTVLTLSLDRGNWLILAGLYSQDVTSGGSIGVKYTLDSWINIPGEAPFKSSTTQGAEYFTTFTTTSWSRRAALAAPGNVYISARPTAPSTTVGTGFAYILAIGA